MNLKETSLLRLCHQHLIDPVSDKPEKVLKMMGAMQAQDYAMAKLAVGMRMKAGTEKIVQHALDSGKILRSHVLRPTWHFVPAQDIYWMNTIGAARIKAAMVTRDKELELTEKIFTKALTIIEKSLGEGEHLSREELAADLQKQKISTDKNRMPHILLRAELEGIACSGRMKGKQQTYALLSERVPKKQNFLRVEALVKLAKIYFGSRGPATVEDFSWWSGLALKEAKEGLENIKKTFVSETIGGQIFWMNSVKKVSPVKSKSIFLLPAFDEYIISYKDRTAAILNEHHSRAISSNGLFWPLMLMDGKAIGIWKRKLEKKKVILSSEFFVQPTALNNKLFSKSLLSLENFWEKKIELSFI